MNFSGFSHYATGVAIPVAALRGEGGLGIGEFADLPKLGEWCRDCGLDFIQILPVNDTGFQASPYSALSAFALHPVYLRLVNLPELDDRRKAMQDLRKEIVKAGGELEERPRVVFHEIAEIKLGFLKRIYELSKSFIAADTAFSAWLDRNSWVRIYAAYSLLKEMNGGASWVNWKEYRNASQEDIEALWAAKEHENELLFFAWVQKRLEDQFRDAAVELDGMGVFLKGDLPILMSEDSADVWAHPDLFRRDLRAGAPPDMFSEIGQNWGFPIYDWEALGKQDYAWWRERLERADLFYHAFRIDHVLGFFRIWAIPEKEVSGILGYFRPSRYITADELRAKGFDDARIRWMSLPHVSGSEIQRTFGVDTLWAEREWFQRIGNEDLFLFQDRVSERFIRGLSLPPERRSALIGWYRNRTLVEAEKDLFAPAWYRDGSRAYGTLNDGEKRLFGEIVSRYFRESESDWSAEAEKLLGFMKKTTHMLPCAEDLGVVPDCVPVVLGKLGILSLKIPRWARKYKEPGEPYIPPRDYPFLSVCAASVHDTTTLRDWWEHEADRESFWGSLGYSGPPPRELVPEAAERLFEGLLAAGSALAMFQLQDYLALSGTFRTDDPEEERINVPGTVTAANWSYRLPMTLGALRSDEDLCRRIRNLVERRRSRKAPPRG